MGWSCARLSRSFRRLRRCARGLIGALEFLEMSVYENVYMFPNDETRSDGTVVCLFAMLLDSCAVHDPNKRVTTVVVRLQRPIIKKSHMGVPATLFPHVSQLQARSSPSIVAFRVVGSK